MEDKESFWKEYRWCAPQNERYASVLAKGWQMFLKDGNPVVNKELVLHCRALSLEEISKKFHERIRRKMNE